MKKATALMKQIVALLSSVAKAKSIAIKNKTSAFKTRLLMLSLVKQKKLGSAASTVEAYDVHEEESDKYPDLRHTLFEGEEEFGDLEEGQGSSMIDLVRSSKEEEGGSFKLEDEIDHVADLFISRFHKQMKLQKLLSFKRYQEMLARGT
ncbi:unnamed protein product [Arabis nemorensis]|uniref:DUF761 domain-containing protein n=1 Tax=Arabis nemorensis TaxID=586526 RepID=A0A565CPD9_9BRAS|nr:unnamed protein product [Arabis nemorensis]